ncbi:MAG: hypothetical protein QF886_02240, partial [Planctomycetota bacterium]|nr:hypothetical protein [Planctomycetota bacterium]
MSRTPLLVPNILLVIVAFSFCLPAQAERIHTGILTYPLRHNISLEEGTLECWVKFRFEPSEVLPKQEFQGLLGFLSLSGESGGIGASYFAGSIFRPEAGWHLRFTPQSKMLPLGKRTVWKKDEWHHWAFTWKGRDTWFYLDGKEVSHRSHPTSFTDVVGSLGGKPVLPHWPFFFGERWNVGAKFVMDDMRLSLVARKPEELGFHVGELKPDPYTAILDPFVHIVETDGKQFTSPSIILNGQGGLPTSLCKTVKGRFGNGLSLIKLPDDEPPVIVGRIAKPAFPERISNPRYDRLHPRLGIPIVTRPPTIDGIVGAREWFASAAIGYLLDDETGLAGHQNSTVRLAYDEKALYIAFRFERPSHNLRPSNDDLCEVRLHSKDHPKPFALRANISRIVHAETADRSSPSSVYRARLTDFGWEGELALPWSAIADT